MASSKFLSAMALLPRALSSSAEAILWCPRDVDDKDGSGMSNISSLRILQVSLSLQGGNGTRWAEVSVPAVGLAGGEEKEEELPSSSFDGGTRAQAPYWPQLVWALYRVWSMPSISSTSLLVASEASKCTEMCFASQGGYRLPGGKRLLCDALTRRHVAMPSTYTLRAIPSITKRF